jgi:hypothetical protein
MITLLRIELPIRLASVSNLREHWSARARRFKSHRETAYLALRPYGVPDPPLQIEITRIAPRKLDSDNLSSAAKGLRDGIADWLGVDDGDPRLEWIYSQELKKGMGNLMGFTAKGSMQKLADIRVRIEIRGTA